MRPEDPETTRTAGPESVQRDTGAEASDTTAEPATDSTTDPTSDSTTEREVEEKPWWDDPRLPWRGKPRRADIACWVGIVLIGIYSFAMLPLRPVLIGSYPLLLVGLTGSRSGLVTIGALAAVGRADWWWIGLALGCISLVKFDLIYYAAGRLWGRGLLEIVAGRSARARRNAERAERLAQRFGVPAVLLSQLIPVIPNAVIYATVAAAGMRFRTFVLLDLASALVINSLWVYLGSRLGQRAVDVVEVIARYSTWISLALLAFVIASAVIRSRRRQAV
ncbi:DedA family protein [Microlunatus kandeliicorticis]|nr:VTT domain-containing protein [Microlunatus kandeliicorticis]